MADGGIETGARAQPRIILTQDEGSDGPDLMDWHARFGRRSPLSRKIISLNLLALGVLLTGVLFLNQSNSRFIELRAQTLVAEAELAANVLADNLGPEGIVASGDGLAMNTLVQLQKITASRMFLFDADAELIGMVAPNFGVATAPELVVVNESHPDALTSIFLDLWDRLSRLFQAQTGQVFPLEVISARPLAERTVKENRIVEQVGNARTGERLVSVGVPIVIDEQIMGAVVMMTRPGDLDDYISAERERILQVFVLAIVSSIVLSLVLAKTIVGPLRDLAEAAHEGGTRDASQLNPQQINIPDMTARPDELGYLSGAMRLMTSALYKRIQANESFAADVAHEIKNPLTSLRSAVETMPYAKTDEDRQRLLTVIKQDVDRLDRLVTDISNASRLDGELVRDRMEPFDLHKLLWSLIEFNEELAGDAGATLRRDFEDQPLTINGMEGRLAQVFVNLIGNAISFAGEGDEITVRTEQTGKRRVRVYVEDQGPGIPEENLKDVFERFYSERPEREEYGNHSGLGLAISRQIVEAHGGRIWAENIRPDAARPDSPSQGARFVVELPV